MDISTLIPKVKLRLRITTDDFNSEITDLINACIADLGIAGVNGENVIPSDDLIIMAVSTYCKMNFGTIGKDEYDRLKASYDEQKAQVSMATGYTVWTEAE
jgi:hypothetical protein